MRIALLILTPAFGFLMLLYTFGFGTLATVVGEGSVNEAGRNIVNIGIVLTLGWLLGMAFALRYPWASVVFYGLGGIIALFLARTNVELAFAIVSLGFATLSYAGSRELKAELQESEMRHQELLSAIEALNLSTTSHESLAPQNLLPGDAERRQL